ncbi:MAG: VOC family protein [Erysipelotrichaceae bacterium]|nr:VOC family protein [Erysipelotrichaceae bacterium]
MSLEGSIVFLPVSDISATLDFYGNTLGLKLAQMQGTDCCIFDTGYGHLGFVHYDDGRKPLSGPQGVCISLNLPSNQDVLDRFEELKDHVSVYREPARHPKYDVYSFFILDPDGYLVEYQKIA